MAHHPRSSTLLYLVAAVLGVVVCRSLKLPPMLGYLVVGVVIGPNALALGAGHAPACSTWPSSASCS